VGSFWQDVRYGARMLARSPAFALIAVVTMALGIGANTAIFSVADGLLWKPVPFPDLARLVMVLELHPQQTRDWNSVSPATYLDWKEQSRSFESMAAFRFYDVNLTGSGEPESLEGVLVSHNYFDVLGMKPRLGRAFLPEEDQEGHDGVVVLSHGLWSRRFGADPDILGKTVKLEGKDHVVIGVMGRDFDFPRPAELWMPLPLPAAERQNRANHYLQIVARLRPDISVTEAAAEMGTIARRLGDAYPETNRGWGARVMPLREFVAGDMTRAYTFVLMGAVGFVLLIACANVANLQFARGLARQRELAVRAALGAERWRLVRQLLTENILLALAGAVVGLVFAVWAIDLIVVNMPPEVEKYIAGWRKISLDFRALFFTAGLAILSGLVAGVLPAFQGTKSDVSEALKEGARSGTGRGRHRMRGALVVAQVTLALVLLVGAGLMVKGFGALLNLNQSFDPATLLTFRVNLPDGKYKDDEKRRVVFFEQALERLSSLPGVDLAAVASRVPFSDGGGYAPFTIEGQPAPQPGELRFGMFQNISPDFLRAVNAPLLDGRNFTAADGADATRVALISRRLAERYFPGQSPLGHKIKLGTADAQNPWMTIVGVVADVRYNAWEHDLEPVVYRPFWQAGRQSSYFVLRTKDAAALAAAVRSQIAAVDPEQPIYDVKTLAVVFHHEMVGLAYVSVMLAVLGGIALVLASVGVYALMAFAVTERTHEIGIRMALGAQPRNVLGLVLRRGVLLTLGGMVLGLVGAQALARVLAGLIFGVSATDPLTFAGVPLLLAAVAFVACYIPARRATRVDPMVALRYE
jgi:putative ABC transport system permease protein